ncbi:MAG: autotransporter-associated beta strand repeat-containing protein [Pirellulales bacterium]
MYTTGGNGDSLWVEGATTFVRDLYLQNDGRLTLNGVISGNGTFNKRAGSDLFINADNSTGYKGGTILSVGGTTYFGAFEGHQVTLSETAKLGPGNIIVNPLSALQINSAGNLNAGQAIYVGGNLNDFGMLRLASNLTLEQVGLRYAGLGGVQNGSNNYYFTASNPSTGVLSLNAIYTHALDMSTLGDGMWYLGSSTNGVGASGAYDASTLKPGLGATYRLGAGGASLFFGTNGNADVVTDYGTPSNLVVGATMSIQNNNPLGNGIGTVVFLTSQNYTGTTVVNRSSTLDFRGTLATSSIDVYGVLNVAGEAGTFFSGGVGSNIPVNLRPGSTLRFDNTTAGVLPVTAVQGRWEDSVGISLNDSIVRLQGNTAVEVVETAGTITANMGAGQLQVVRGVTGRGVELRTPAITRNTGTIQFVHNSSTLGADERVIVTGAAPTVTNGMVSPWMISLSDLQFLTYNADTGFTIAGFDRVTGATTFSSTLNASTSRAFVNGNIVLNSGIDYSVHALRLEANATLGTATDNTAQIILGSGGLLVNGARTITTGIVAGTVNAPTELFLFNNNNLTLGDSAAASRNVQGQILASSITKFGTGQLQMRSEQQTFTGDIRVQGGSLMLYYANGAETNPVSKSGGNGGTIYMDGANTTLFLRGGTDASTLTGNVIFNNSVVLGDYNPIVQIDVDRFGGNLSGRGNVIGGDFTFGANNAETGQILRFRGVNDMFLQIGDSAADKLTLVGKSVFDADNNNNANDGRIFVSATTTGSGMLVKGPVDSRSDLMQLQNVSTLNDWTGGTIVMGGTLRIFAKSTNGEVSGTGQMTAGGASTGTITLLGGVLDLRTDADATEQASTYTQSGTTVTITRNGHGYANNNTITIASGPLAGTYIVANSATNTFTITAGFSATIATATAVGIIGADSQLERSIYQTVGSQVPDVIVSGSTQINVDRTGLVAQGSNKQIVMGNLTIGQQILTVSGANGYGLEFAGTTTLLGNMFLNNTTDLVFSGNFADEGAGTLLNKIGTGTLWINSTNNSAFGGGIYVNAGLLAFGNRLANSNTATIGSGAIQVNPGAQIRVNSVANINTAAGQTVRLVGTPYSPAIFRAVGSFAQTDYQNMIEYSTSTSNSVTVIAFEGSTITQNLDQSTIGDGRVFFGNIGDRVYNGATDGYIIPGLSNLPNSVVGGDSTNRVYRLGGGSGNTLSLVFNGVGNVNDYTGPTDVQIGSLAQLGPSGNLFSGFVYFQDQNTYTGQTIIVRGSTLRTNQAVAANQLAGPFGSNAAAPIHVYGAMRLENSSSLRNAANTGNFYTNIQFHPTSLLLFQDVQPNGNRWHDDAEVLLDGASLQVVGGTNTNLGSEAVGTITFDRGTRIIVNSQGTGDAIFTASGIVRAAASTGAGTGRGTMVFQPTATARLSQDAASTNNAEKIFFTSTPSTSAVSAIANMLPGYYVEGIEQRFVTYGATGITPVADGQMTSAFTAGMTAGSAVVNIASAVTLPDFAPSLYALRTAGNINSPTGANNDATITFAGSGNDIGSIIFLNGTDNTTVSINPNVRFGAAGTAEGVLYFAGGGTNRNVALAGFINAGSMTKFGVGTIQIAADQSDAARGVGLGYSGGWVINEGGLNLLTFGSAGNAVASNTIVINGNRASTSTLFLRAPSTDSTLNYAYTSGRIIAVDNATIDWDPGADDRVHSIADIEIQQSGGIGNAVVNSSVDAMLRVAHNRNRAILAAGTLFVTNNAILNVDLTATPGSFVAYTQNASYLTIGSSSGMSVAALNGSARLTKWGDGYLYVRGASPSFSGNLVIDQGAVYVTDNGSLGTGAVTVNRYGVLDIGVVNYTATNSSITFNEGSIQRWSVDGARSGNVDLGKATLQVAADQFNTNAVVRLNGGSIEAWLRTDDITSTNHSGGVFRNLGPNVSVVLGASSYLGSQYYLGANGLDNGRQANNDRPGEEYVGSGAILDIKGVISEDGGAFALNKVGYDTVILSNHNTYTGGTTVSGGTLRVGINDALFPTSDLKTVANGVFDLNGYDQTVRRLTNPMDPTSVGVNGGYITNSAAAVRTLAVGNGTNELDTFSYHGVIQHNVALQKIGAGRLVLTNSNTYVGGTTVTDGVLQGLAATSGSPFGSGGFTLAGGTLALVGIDATTNTATAGTLTVTETSILRLDGSANTAGITQFTVGSLVQQNGAGLIVVPVTGRLGDPGTKERFTVTNTTGLLSGGIVPWVFAADTPTPNSTLSFVTLSGNNLVSTSSATSIDVPNAAPNLAYVAATGNDNNLDSDPNWGSVQVNAGVTITAAPLGYVLTLGDGNSGTLLLNGGNSLASGFFLRFSGQGNIVTAGASSSIVGANIVNSAAGVTINGSQPVIFTGTNSYTGPTLIQSAQLTINSAASIPSNNAITLSNDAGAALVFNSNATVGSIAGGGAAGGNVSIGANSLTVNQAANVTYAGTINGAGNIFKQGAGVWTLSGTSNFTGQMQIDAGTISIASEANLGADAGALNFNQLIFNGGTLQTTATMAINDTSRGITVSAFGGAVNVANNTTLSIANPVSGGGGDFTKTGGGTLTFTNNTNHFYASNLVVAGGTVNGNGHIPAQVTVQAGGTLSAGSNANGVNNNGVGTIAFGDFGVSDWQNNASFVFDFGNNGSGTAGTDWDLITIGAGGLNLSGSNYLLTVFSWDLVAGTYGTNNFNPNALPTIDVPEPGADAAYRWLWVDNAGPLSGVVDGRLDQFVVAVGSPAAYPTISGGNFWVSAYNGDLYINYSAVPEPSSLMLLSLAGLGFAGYRRRKRSQAAAAAESSETTVVEHQAAE